MPRTFTPDELQTMTLPQVAALSCEDMDAFHTQWLALAVKTTAENEAKWVLGDYDYVDSRQRFEYGE